MEKKGEVEEKGRIFWMRMTGERRRRRRRRRRRCKRRRRISRLFINSCRYL